MADDLTAGFYGNLSLGAFAPQAFFDKHMDCIRVTTLDRSVTEVRLSDMFSIHRCNHRGRFDPEYVGFTIKGVQHMFVDLELPVTGAIKLTKLFDALVKRRPGGVATMIEFILQHHNVASDLVVDMDVQSEAA
jgi:hypothetical protein